MLIQKDNRKWCYAEFIFWCFLLNERPNTQLTYLYIVLLKTFLLRVAAIDLFNHSYFDPKITQVVKSVLINVPLQSAQRVRGLALWVLANWKGLATLNGTETNLASLIDLFYGNHSDMKSQVNGPFREPTWALISNIANTWVHCCHCCQRGYFEPGLFFETAGDAWIGGVLNGHWLTSCLITLFLNNPPRHLFLLEKVKTNHSKCPSSSNTSCSCPF